MRSARFRRSATCRRTCMPGRSGANATATRRPAMQQEVVPTPIPESDEVLVMVMAAGVNYNGVWASLGLPISPFDVHKAEYHIAGSDASGIVWAVGSQGEALEGRRRGGHPLQPGRRRRRGVQWRRSDELAEPAHLGLRDPGRLLSPSSAPSSPASSCRARATSPGKKAAATC